MGKIYNILQIKILSLIKNTSIIIMLSALVALAAEDLVWNGANGFSGWGQPVRMQLRQEDGVMKVNITGADPSLTIRDIDVNPSDYSQIEFEYRGKGFPEKNTGQIYFAGKGQSLSQDRCFSFSRLRPDGEWHKAIVTKLRKGMDSWLGVERITQLRFDIIDQDSGDMEIREFRLTNLQTENAIYPGEDDFADISAAFLHIVRFGKNNKMPFWIGKSNQFDHRHRGLFRIPLETLIPRGSVSKAIFEMRLASHYGPTYEREYIVEALNEDIQKFKALDVRADATVIGKVKIGEYSVCEPVRLDITSAVNVALVKVNSAITLRVRPEPEENNDPCPSGAVVDLNTVRMIFQ